MGLTTSVLLLAALAANPQAEVTTLKGEEFSGELVRLTATELAVKQGDQEKSIPLSDVLDIGFSAEGQPPEAATQVMLGDGTRLQFAQVSTTSQSFTGESPALGTVKVPLTAVNSIRLAATDAKVAEAWQGLKDREIRKDLLVMRKGDILDHLDGFVGSIDQKAVNFQLEGQNYAVGREKVFGIVYARREFKGRKPVCEVTLQGNQRLQVAALRWENDRFQAELAAGGTAGFAPEHLQRLDYSLGKVQYLSRMEPRDVKYTPYFDVVWEYRRDTNYDNDTVRLDGTLYKRALTIHSRTLLRYRIGDDYRRFQAVMGIDDVVGNRGNVHVVISGDGKTLLEADVTGLDEARELDLPVSGVRDLEILVDFGGDLDIADHLVLAEARVIK